MVAVEPMLNLGEDATRVLGDGWTVVTADGSLSAHFEHTVAVTQNYLLCKTDNDWTVTQNGHEVLTARNGR